LLRKSRNGLKRIGLLALALVIALGSLGVAYSVWTDEVYIEGTVQTGTLNVNAMGSSSTFAYKVPGGGDVGYGPETEVHYCPGYADQYPPDGVEGEDYILVASAVATFDNGPTDPDTAAMAFSGLFPGVDFRADLKMLYMGTVPAKVSVATICPPKGSCGPVLGELWAMGESTKNDATRYGIWMEAEHTANADSTKTQYNDPLGIQLQHFDELEVTLHVRLPEDPDYENLDGLSFTGIISVIQWNLYGVEE